MREVGDLPQASDGLGAQLADARLGHAELDGDVAKRPFFEEGAGEHQPLASGELRHRLVEDPPAIGLLDGLPDLVAFARADPIGQCVTARLAFEGDRANREGPFPPAMHGLVIHTEMTGDFAGGGGAPEPLLALRHGAVKAPSMRAVHPGERIARAKFVENGTADAAHGKGRKSEPALGLEARHGLEQSDRTCRDQFLKGHGIANPRGHLSSGVMDQSEVTTEKLTARFLVVPSPPALPERVGGSLVWSLRCRHWNGIKRKTRSTSTGKASAILPLVSVARARRSTLPRMVWRRPRIRYGRRASAL